MRMWAWILLTLCLTACGFHLRGNMPLAEPLHHLYVQSSDPYSELVRNLKQALKLSGVELTGTPVEATTILDIMHEDQGQQMVSVSGTQQTRQYNLTLSVTFRVTDNNNKVLVPEQTATETAAITIQANEVLAGSNEATNIYQQMRRAIVFDIMYRLASKSTAKQLLVSPR